MTGTGTGTWQGAGTPTDWHPYPLAKENPDVAPTDWQTEQPPLATPATVPARVDTPAGSPTVPAPPAPLAPDWPSRWHLLVPAALRNTAAALGLWQNPVPLRPSDHLTQTLAVLERYGWCKSLDFSPTGRMCIRGAQNTTSDRTA